MANRRQPVAHSSDWKPPFVFPKSDSTARPTEQVRALRYWYQTFTSTQKFRIVGGNRLSAWQREMDTAPETLSPQANEMAKTAASLETIALRECRRILDTMPIWTEWLHHVRGIDVALGSAMLSLLLPPRQDKTVASWYKAAGLDVVNASPKSEVGPDEQLASDSEMASVTTLASEDMVGSEAEIASDRAVGSVRVLASDGALGADDRMASGRVVGSDSAVASVHIMGSEGEVASESALVSENAMASGMGMGSDAALASDARLGSDEILASDNVMDSEEEVASDPSLGSVPNLAHKRRHPARTDPSVPHLPRYVKGQTATWHPQLRRTLYLVGESLIRSGRYYREFYLQFKAAYTAKHPEKPPWLLDRIARWRTVKLLLSHLWHVWAEMDAIPHAPPYPISILGHDAEHYRLPPVSQQAKM